MSRNNIASLITVVVILVALPVTLVLGVCLRLHYWAVQPVLALWSTHK